MTTYKPTGKMLLQSEREKILPQEERETLTFSGVDHMAALARARAAGEPPPATRDPLRSGTDPFKAAYENLTKGK